MSEAFCLDPAYSTTRCVTRTVPVVFNSPDAKFESMLFLPTHPQRKGEGGLRRQGYFKAGGCTDNGVDGVKIKPLITAITVVFNGAKTLEQTILSVIKQSYDNVEYIIIDGGSTDGALDSIQKYEHAIDYWVSEPDTGIYDAWNKGVRCANGEWICFLGADDYLHNTHVLEEMAVVLATAVPRYRIVYGQVVVVDEHGTEIDRLGELPWGKVKSRFMGGAYCLPTPGVMHHRSLFELFGPYDNSFKIAGDYELLLRELKTNEPKHAPEIIVADMQYGGISSRPENTLIALREMRAALVKHGLAETNRITALAFFRAYLRIALWRLLGEHVTRQMLDFGRWLMCKKPYWTRH